MRSKRFIAGLLSVMICMMALCSPVSNASRECSLISVAANIKEETESLVEGQGIKYTYNLPIASAVSSNTNVVKVTLSDDAHSVTLTGVKAGKADVTILGGSGDGDLVHVTVSAAQGGSERFTVDSLNMQKGDVLNLEVQGDPGDTIQVHFYYTDENGNASSSLVGGLGGTVLDSNGKKTVSFTAPNALNYITIKVVYGMSKPTYSVTVDYKTPIVTTTTTTTTKPMTTTTKATTTTKPTTTTTKATTTTKPTTTTTKATTTTKPTTTTTKTTTTATTTTTKAINSPTKSIVWGRDNWNFYNSSKNGDFNSTTFRQQMLKSYQDVLIKSLDNIDYEVIFKGYTDMRGNYHKAWIDEKWDGACYGMSSTTLLSQGGLLPYSEYGNNANCLYNLSKPSQSMNVSSLISYYQMLQVKDVIQQQYRTVPLRSHETNINDILSTLDKSSCAVVGYEDDDWGGHAVLAYGYEYGSWTWNGVTYNGHIFILDPNHSVSHSDEHDIYFNSRTYNWNIPHYPEVASIEGSVFNYIGSNIDEINDGGYLKGGVSRSIQQYVARIDAFAAANSLSVTKVKQTGNSYLSQNTAAGDIVAAYSYRVGGETEGVFGYNLFDSDSAYKITQRNAETFQFAIDYDNCMLRAGSAAGSSAIFDKTGYVRVEGEAANYNISMVYNDYYPTDWYAFNVTGENSDVIEMKKVDNGYILSGDNLQGVKVCANNRDVAAEVRFTTDYDSVLLYEIDKYTIGVAADTDKNGSYETMITRSAKSDVYGDVNLDGTLNIADAVLLQKYLLGAASMTKYQGESADLYHDGRIDVFDLVLLRRALIKSN